MEAILLEETKAVFRKTYYGRKYTHISAQNIEEFYNYMLRTTLEKEARRDPILSQFCTPTCITKNTK